MGLRQCTEAEERMVMRVRELLVDWLSKFVIEFIAVENVVFHTIGLAL